MPYSTEERVTIVENYFRTNSYAGAKAALALKFPGIPEPSDSTIKRLVDKFRKTGSVQNAKRGGRPGLPEEKVLEVQAALLQSPWKSVRETAQQTGVSYGSVQKITRRLKMHPQEAKAT